MAKRIRIGIDPDIEKNGFCLIEYTPFEKPVIKELSNPTFWALIEIIRLVFSDNKKTDVLVFIEAGWQNKKSNFHYAKNISIATKISKNVGENHAVGKLLQQYCEFNNYPYKLLRPTSEKWDGRKFKMITGYDKRTNQEQRDAVKTAWL